MRHYDILFGILLILSITDFAFALPVLVQEKRDLCGNVTHIPKDETTVLGKRFEELDNLNNIVGEYFKKWGVLDWWPGSTQAEPEIASSSSAPAGPEHAFSAQAGPERVSSFSTLMGEPEGVPSALAGPEHASSAQAGPEHVSSFSALMGEPERVSSALAGPDHASSGHERVSSFSALMGEPERVSSALAVPDHASSAQAGPKRVSSSSVLAGPGRVYVLSPSPEPKEFESVSSSSSLPGLEPVSSSSALVGLDHGSMNDVQVPAKNPSPSINPDGPNINLKYWFTEFGPPPQRPKLALSKEFGQANEDQVMHVQQPGPTPLNPGPYDARLPQTQPGYEVVTAPSLNVLPPKRPVGRPKAPWPSDGKPKVPYFNMYYHDSLFAIHSAKDKAPGLSNPRPPIILSNPRPPIILSNPRLPIILDFERDHPDLSANDKAPGPSNPRPPTDLGYGVATASSPNRGQPQEHVQQANPVPWNTGAENTGPYDARLSTESGYGLATGPLPNLGWHKEHMQQPNPGLGPWNPLASNSRPPTGPGYGETT